MTSVRSLMRSAKARLLSAFTARQSLWNSISSASGSSCASSCSRSAIHLLPICRVMSALSLGLLSAIQRRGVTPLVTLRIFSGATP